MRSSSFLASTVAALLIVGVGSPAAAQYIQTNLVSDGAIPARLPDASLVNAWGLAATPTSPWWIADNGTGTSTVYNAGTGAIVLHVAVPGSPTGLVANTGPGFVVPGHGTARFLFANEEGMISGWAGGPAATVLVDNSATGAVYKGLAISHNIAGDFIYATNFRAATVEVYNSSLHLVPGGFRDPTIPAGYAPFGIQNIAGTIYVTYALQDANKHDDVAGEGHGFVNAFDMAGNLLRRVASQGTLNSPWGLAWAPASFGRFGGELLVGNFGDGHIHAFDPRLAPDGEFRPRGALRSPNGKVITIDGLWALQFGHGAAANGPTDTLFFTAGPFDESHGLFGTLTAVHHGDNDDDDR
jgi:uncharacterized protein (TIGR03118 family)